MIGIVSYSAYIPYHYLERNDLSKIWDRDYGLGEKAVANFDEDSVTMSVEAARECLAGRSPQDIDRLYFASTTAPYFEKQAASIIAGAVNLQPETLAIDFSGTLRAGTDAMITALDALHGGTARNVLVCAADVRQALPQGEKEGTLGDGAAAVLLGRERVVASILWFRHAHDDVLDIWRSDRDRYVRSWEGRFIREATYGQIVRDGITNALKEKGCSLNDFSKVILNGPNIHFIRFVARKLGLNEEIQLGGHEIFRSVGDTGTALPLMLLICALEDAKPGDKLLLMNYGDGYNLLALAVESGIEEIKGRIGVRAQLSSRKKISYEKYLCWREILPVEPPPRPPADQSRPSAVALWRDRKNGLSLNGVLCRKCGTPQYPVQRVCYRCGSKDCFEKYCFANRKAKITSFSHDMLSPSLDAPTTVCAVDFEGGGRIMCEMTDRDPGGVKVGMPVEMTFRRLFYRAEFYTYWWKCRPLRK